MPRARDPNRDIAFEIYKKHNGNIELTEIANQLNLSAGTIRGWKSKDNWEHQLNGTLQLKNTERSKQKESAHKEEKRIQKAIESVIEDSDLNDRQQMFCLYYSKTFNATQSYKKAFECSYDVANAEGYKLLVNPCIKSKINELKRIKAQSIMVSEEDIVEKYINIAFADITDYVSFGQEEVPVTNKGVPIEIIDEDTGDKSILMKVTSFVKFNESAEVDGTIITEVKKGKDGVSVKLADRMKALEWLSNHMGMASEEQKLRLEKLRVDIAKAKEDDTGSIEDDGFVEALKSEINEVWEDDED